MQLEQATKTSLKPTTHFSFNQSEVITLVSEIITCCPSNNLFLLLASKEMTSIEDLSLKMRFFSIV